MSLVDYTKHFSDNSQGPRKHTFLLAAIVQPLREPSLSIQDEYRLTDVISMTQKGILNACGVMGSSTINKGLLLANIANKIKKNVILVSPDFFTQIATSEFAKLLADIQQHNAILYFEQADKLLNGDYSYANNNQKLDTDLLFKTLSGYPSLSIFSIQELETAELLKARHVTLLATH